MALSYPRILISAGEHSGDMFGARLASALKQLRPDVRLSGLGGPQMRAAGVRLLADTAGHAGMGFLYPLLHLNDWARVYRRCIRELNHEPPDVFVPIDNPGFNLRLSDLVTERRIPICYYVSPQVWAWHSSRIHKIAKLVSHMMVLLPFEKPLYDSVGVDCTFVGHPLLDYMPEREMHQDALADIERNGDNVVGILPGSRRQEVLHTFPLICDAAARIRQQRPETIFHVAAAAQEHAPMIERIVASRHLSVTIHVGRTPEIMKASRLCLAVSGTATLETAYYQTPMVVVYRATAFGRHIVPRLLQVPYICLVNIIAEREVVPEFLMFDDNAAPIAKAALNLLNDAEAWERCREGLREVIAAMGPRGTSKRAAQIVLEHTEPSKGN